MHCFWLLPRQARPVVTTQKHVAAGIIVSISSSVWHPMSNRANISVSGNSSSSSQAPARTFLRSNRTLQHRQALLPSGSSASSDSSLLSQQSGVKFGRAARVGALGVAAGGPPAPQRGTVVKGLHKHISTFAPFGNGKIRFLNCCPVPCCAVPCYAVPCYAMSMSSLSSAAKTNQCTPTASPSVCQERPAPCFMPQGPLRCLGDYV